MKYIDVYHEIERLKNQENSEPQTHNDSSNGVVTKKVKLTDSQFEPVNRKLGQNNSIIKIPDYNLDFEVSSSANKVICFR